MALRRRVLLGFAASAAVAGAITSCAPPEAREERCERVKRQLDACAGVPLAALDCAAISSGDLDRLDDLGQGVACQALQGVAPVDGDAMSAACHLLGVGCVAPVTPPPRRTPTRYPVLLVNGIDTSPLFRYSERIVSTMRSEGGHRVYLATLTPYQTPRRRAPELWRRIEEVRRQTGAAKVNLVCHSLGGLDCRYLASPAGLAADRGDAPDAMSRAVASISTVGTAHRGTRVADVLLGSIDDADRGRLADDFASAFGEAFSPSRIAGDADVRGALAVLSTAAAPAFNDEIVDAPGVVYQSWAGISRPFGVTTAALEARAADLCRSSDGNDGRPSRGTTDFMALPLVPMADVAGRAVDGEGLIPNDGLANVASARWGAFRGCIPADHMEQLGQKNLPDTNVRTGFEVARFYANLAGDLAAAGL